ncbi:hypothetical protein TWF281_011961 [Arthrobotrys megalospora]
MEFLDLASRSIDRLPSFCGSTCIPENIQGGVHLSTRGDAGGFFPLRPNTKFKMQQGVGHAGVEGAFTRCTGMDMARKNPYMKEMVDCICCLHFIHLFPF